MDIRGATDKQLANDVKNLLVVMNHFCRLDWLFTWTIELRYGWGRSKVHSPFPTVSTPVHACCRRRPRRGVALTRVDLQVIVLKSGLRHIPGIGWAMQMLRYVFVNRSWTRDEERMSCVMRSIQRDGPASVLMFPEGTDLTKDTKAKAQQFAKDRDLPQHENVLVPRSRGFAHIFNIMKSAPSPLVLWDVTVG